MGDADGQAECRVFGDAIDRRRVGAHGSLSMSAMQTAAAVGSSWASCTSARPRSTAPRRSRQDHRRQARRDQPHRRRARRAATARARGRRADRHRRRPPRALRARRPRRAARHAAHPSCRTASCAWCEAPAGARPRGRARRATCPLPARAAPPASGPQRGRLLGRADRRLHRVARTPRHRRHASTSPARMPTPAKSSRSATSWTASPPACKTGHDAAGDSQGRLSHGAAHGSRTSLLC